MDWLQQEKFRNREKDNSGNVLSLQVADATKLNLQYHI